MFKSTSTSLILAGVLAIVVGVIAIAWPGATVLALVILFAVYALIGAGMQAARAFASATGGPVLVHLLLAVIDLAAGIVAVAWPAATALVLVWVVAAWAFLSGATEITLALADREVTGTRTMLAVTGLISIAFGVVLSARPDVGVVTIALLFGLYSLVYGAAAISLGEQMRRSGQARGHVLHPAA